MRPSALVALGGAALLARTCALRIPGGNSGLADPSGDTGLADADPSGNILFANVQGSVPGGADPCGSFRLYTAAPRSRGPTSLLRTPPLNVILRPVNVLMGVITNKRMHQTRAMPHFDFHRRYVTDQVMMLYFTDGPADGINNTFKEQGAAGTNHTFNGTDNYTAGGRRFLQAWYYVASGCHGLEFKWYMQFDDDTFVGIPRVSTFVRALETSVGSPYSRSAIIGRLCTWVWYGLCGEVFGGNGILATHKAMRDMKALGGEVWTAALESCEWGDAQVTQMARSANCSIVQMRNPFGVGTWRTQDELIKVPFSNLSATNYSTATISVHKARDLWTWKKATALLELPGADVDTYTRLIEPVKWMFDRNCMAPPSPPPWATSSPAPAI